MVHRRQPQLQPLVVVALALVSLTTIIGQVDGKDVTQNNRLRKQFGPKGKSTSRILNVRDNYYNKRRLQKKGVSVNETKVETSLVNETEVEESEPVEEDVEVEEPIFDSEDEIVSDGDYDSGDSGNSTSTSTPTKL